MYTTSFDDVIDLGGGPIDPGGATHVFLVSHATAGAFQWAEHVGGPPMTVNITGFDAATDCEGNVVLAGTFSGQIEAQGLSLVVAPGVEFDDGMEFPTVDVFLMKFGPDGTLLWGQRFGDQASQRRGVDVQSDGTIVVTGDVQGTLDLGGPPIVAPGPWPDAVLAAFDPSGHFCGSIAPPAPRASSSGASTSDPTTGSPCSRPPRAPPTSGAGSSSETKTRGNMWTVR